MTINPHMGGGKPRPDDGCRVFRYDSVSQKGTLMIPGVSTLRITILAVVLCGTALFNPTPVLGEALPEPGSWAPDSAPDIVTAIYKDRAGFLWIGSREGLSLYDGHSFTVFDHDPSDPNSISDNTVRVIFEDREGNLWLGTNTGGLNRLDRSTWTFEHFRHDSADPNSLSHDSVNALIQDRDGALWVGTQIGLNRFDPSTGSFERYMAHPSDPASLSDNYIYAFHEDREGYLWIGTVGGGLNRMDPATGRFTRYRHDPDDPRSLSYDKVFALAVDTEDALWVATEQGLNRMERASGTFTRVSRNEIAGKDGLYPLVTALAVAPSGKILAGTWGGGLYEVDPGELTVRQFTSMLEEEEGTTERIAALLPMEDGSIWIGSWDYGLRRLRPAFGLFEVAGPGETGGGLSYRDATSILEDRDGGLWVGTWGRGLNHRRPGESVFRPPDPESSGPFGQGTILSLLEDREGSIWVGTMGGMYLLDRSGDVRFLFENDPQDNSSLGAGYVWAIHQDSAGTIWVGTGEGGLNRLRKDGVSFERFVHDASDPGSLSDDYVTAIFEDHGGTLWVGTRSGGLNVMDREAGRFRRYQPVPDDDRSISHHLITSIVQDHTGEIWIGTDGGGFNRVVRIAGGGTVRFERHGEEGGLISNAVMGMAPESDGSIWISTRDGLSRFDPRTGSYANYDTRDGLPTAQFNIGAAFAGGDHLHFGSAKGLVSVPRGTPFPAHRSSPTVLRSIRTLEGPILGEDPAWSLENLAVPYGEILSFEFAVLDFGNPGRHRHAYRLEGVHDDWVDLGTRREITFTNLDPAVYTLHVRGRNDQGVWSESPTVLQIRVVPPFWMTHWFRGAMVLAVVGMVVGVHFTRMAVLKKRNLELQMLKDQREKALEKARASQNALHLAYERLRRLTRRLEAAKENERKHIARELHDEMGQALTTAKINLQLMLGSEDPAERGRRISDTVGLVDRMIGHVRTLSLDLRPPLLDELGLGPALRGYLETQSRRSGVDIRVKVVTVPAGLQPEIEIIAFRVVQEAITNVIRHADAHRVEVSVVYEPGWLDISVKDDGRGFDVEATLDRAARGYHLGLLGIRERVESLGGSVRIESSPGNGAEIAVNVPLE